jgi:hypothetical protein
LQRRQGLAQILNNTCGVQGAKSSQQRLRESLDDQPESCPYVASSLPSSFSHGALTFPSRSSSGQKYSLLFWNHRSTEYNFPEILVENRFLYMILHREKLTLLNNSRLRQRLSLL